jgi:hypothetical protein
VALVAFVDHKRTIGLAETFAAMGFIYLPRRS